MQGAVKSKGLFGNLFRPTTDFYGLLNGQASKTLEGMEALVDWLKNEESFERCQIVRDLETEADQLKFNIAKKLVESFVTPFDREDIYELSQRLDEVINGAKRVAREVEAYDTKPSLHPEIIEMAEILVEGTKSLQLSFIALRNNHVEAQTQAVLACKSSNRVNKCYRRSIKELFENNDVKVILRVKEVYKSLVENGEKIDLVGERLLNTIVKLA